MNKIQMAHEMALELVKIKPSLSAWQIADRCFEYADAMQAEAEKRECKDRPEVLKEEWQPDWSVAPPRALTWAISSDGRATWALYDYKGDFIQYVDAPSFDYQGNWQDSLRKRPQ